MNDNANALFDTAKTRNANLGASQTTQLRMKLQLGNNNNLKQVSPNRKCLKRLHLGATIAFLDGGGRWSYPRQRIAPGLVVCSLHQLTDWWSFNFK